jgi:hypothetical protein
VRRLYIDFLRAHSQPILSPLWPVGPLADLGISMTIWQRRSRGCRSDEAGYIPWWELTLDHVKILMVDDAFASSSDLQQWVLAVQYTVMYPRRKKSKTNLKLISKS